MKRLMLTAAAVCALSMTAMADPTVTLINGEMGDVRWVDGTNLMHKRVNGADQILDLEGNALSDAVYDSYFNYDSGYVVVEAENGAVGTTYGLMNPSGEMMIDFQYGKMEVANSHWVIGYKMKAADANQYDIEYYIIGGDGGSEYMLIENADIYYVEDGNAALVASVPRENYMDSYAQGRYLSVEDRATGNVTMYDGSWTAVAENLRSLYDDGDMPTKDYEIYSENGQQGIKDLDGNVLMAPAFKYIYDVKDGYVRVNTGDAYGLTDMNGNVIVPAEYDDINSCYYAPEALINPDDSSTYVAAGYISVEKDGKAGFVDLNGNVTMVPTYSEDILDIRGASALLTDLEGKQHILAADGVDTVLDEAYKDIYPLYNSFGLLYKVNDDDYNYAVIDWHGNEVIPMGVKGAELSGDGSHMLVEISYDNSALYEVAFNVDYAVAAEAAPAGEAAAEGTESAPAGEAAAEGTEQAEETADQEPAAGAEAAPVVDFAAASAIISSAVTLCEADYEGNAASVRTLIDSAVTLIGDANPSLVTVLSSALTLIDSGAANGVSVATLLNSAAALLG